MNVLFGCSCQEVHVHVVKEINQLCMHTSLLQLLLGIKLDKLEKPGLLNCPH